MCVRACVLIVLLRTFDGTCCLTSKWLIYWPTDFLAVAFEVLRTDDYNYTHTLRSNSSSTPVNRTNKIKSQKSHGTTGNTTSIKTLNLSTKSSI